MASACVSVFLLLFLAFTLSTNVCSASNDTSDKYGQGFIIGNKFVYLTFYPMDNELIDVGESLEVMFNYTIVKLDSTSDKREESSDRYLTLTAQISDENIAKLNGNTEFLIDIENPVIANFSAFTFYVEGLFLGHADVIISEKSSEVHGAGIVVEQPIPLPDSSVTEPSEETSHGYKTGDTPTSAVKVLYHVAVKRPERTVDKIFMGAIFFLVVIINIGMGCKVDLEVVKETLKKPFAPAIALCCQFIIMPLTSFSVIKLLGVQGGVALGFFAVGCSPGGGASNVYTYLLGGDISLSITLTAISTLFSLAMIPAWLYSLGKLVTKDHRRITIPFINIITSLVAIVIPVGIGIILRYKRPKWAEKFGKTLKFVMIFFIVFMCTFGVWASLYIFKLFTPKLVLAGCLLPYIGFLLGGIVAVIFRQPYKRIVTIAIETGIQNSGVALVLMKMSLPQPDADLSLVSPVMVSMFTPIPLWIAIAIYEINKRCKKKSMEDGFQEVALGMDHEEVDAEMENLTDESNNVKFGGRIYKQNGEKGGNQF